MKPFYKTGEIEIYLGDCRDVMPQLPIFDVLLTDPPYGADVDVSRYAGARCVRKYEQFKNEDRPIDFSFLFNYGLIQVVFGANNWPQQLPFNPKRDGWICWDKRTVDSSMLGSPFELAVVIGRRNYDLIRIQHGGAINADSLKGNNEPRFHPTQKPVGLMQRILRSKFMGNSVCDPFMGSGTTLIAAKRLSKSAIGIEIEEKYCEIAAKRLSQEVLDFGETRKDQADCGKGPERTLLSENEV